jgi:hypothetical protein
MSYHGTFSALLEIELNAYLQVPRTYEKRGHTLNFHTYPTQGWNPTLRRREKFHLLTSIFIFRCWVVLWLKGQQQLLSSQEQEELVLVVVMALSFPSSSAFPFAHCLLVFVTIVIPSPEIVPRPRSCDPISFGGLSFLVWNPTDMSVGASAVMKEKWEQRKYNLEGNEKDEDNLSVGDMGILIRLYSVGFTQIVG